MSLPGVESARRRRASHGRSTVGFVQPPPLHRRSCPHLTTPAAAFFNPLRFLDAADRYREVLNERAIAARHRLDERLRDPAVISTPHISNRQHAAASIPRPAEAQPQRLHIRNGGRVMSEEKLAAGLSKMGGHQEDCPVCLDSFSDGQRVIHLLCRHSFHRDCIIPWLQNHHHCPSCRSKIF